jgi:hypothetical protein
LTDPPLSHHHPIDTPKGCDARHPLGPNNELYKLDMSNREWQINPPIPINQKPSF